MQKKVSNAACCAVTRGVARGGPGWARAPPIFLAPTPKKTIAEGDPQKVDIFNHFEISRRSALRSVCYCFDKIN